MYHCETALHMLASPAPELESVVPKSLRSAKVELIDLRSILPWDMNTISESVNRTGRLVIVHEAGVTAGVGAEISAEIQKRCFLKLNAPVKRVGAWEYVLITLRVIDNYLIHCYLSPAFPMHYSMKNSMCPMLFAY